MSQVNINYSAQVTNEAIQRSLDTANRVHKGWSETAYSYLVTFVRTRKEGERFLIEDVRSDASTVVPEPPSYRSWGAIARRAIQAGVILKVGYMKVKNTRAHQATAAVYVSNIN